MQDQALTEGKPKAGCTPRWVMLLLTTLLIAPGLSACWKPVPPPRIHINQNPTERYRLVLILPDQPQNTWRVTAYINYIIENNGRCIPTDKTKALGGITPTVKQKIPLAVTKVSSTQYEATYYMDYFKNEDYYGKGICTWGAIPIYVFYLYDTDDTGYASGGREIVDNPGAQIKQRCPLRRSSDPQRCFDMDSQIKLSDSELFFVTTTTYKVP